MISTLLLIYQIIRDKCGNPKIHIDQLYIYLKAGIMLVMIAIVWILYLKFVVPNRFHPQGEPSYYQLMKLLFSYPELHRHILRPMIHQNIIPILILASLGIAFFLFFPSIVPHDKSIATALLLLFLIISLISFTKTTYHHIRYIYFLFPIFLLYCAYAILFILSKVKKSFNLQLLSILIITTFLIHQSLFAFNMINSEPGAPMPPFTAGSPPFYVDYKTCGTYLTKNRKERDYVIAFASAHQATVYSGTIDACYRPTLGEHTGKTHFRTGSVYLDSKEELLALTKTVGKNIWFIYSKKDIHPNTWQYRIISSIENYTVCESPDKNTVLIKVPSKTFAQLSTPGQ
jgi:hypothetical protein